MEHQIELDKYIELLPKARKLEELDAELIRLK